jgi:hypothetical protein
VHRAAAGIRAQAGDEGRVETATDGLRKQVLKVKKGAK